MMKLKIVLLFIALVGMALHALADPYLPEGFLSVQKAVFAKNSDHEGYSLEEAIIHYNGRVELGNMKYDISVRRYDGTRVIQIIEIENGMTCFKHADALVCWRGNCDFDNSCTRVSFTENNNGCFNVNHNFVQISSDLCLRSIE